MHSKDIFIGTIKKCTNLYGYENYGDEHFVPEFQICSTIHGSLRKYVEKIDEKAILIKVDDNNYVWLESINSKIDEFLINRGFAMNTIGVSPVSNNSLFVDKETLKPYFDKEIDNLKVKDVKLLTLGLKK